MKSIALQIDHIKGKIKSQENLIKSDHYKGEIDDDILDTYKSILESLNQVRDHYILTSSEVIALNYTIDKQINFISFLKAENFVTDRDKLIDLCNAVIGSLNKLKKQEELIDQQADETSSKQQFTLPEGWREQTTQVISINGMIELQSREIAEIKDIVTHIANKYDIDLDNVHKDAAAPIDYRAATSAKDNGRETIDPAIKLLLGGGPSTMGESKILQLFGLLSSDISILGALFNAGCMTVSERDRILDNMHFKTTDLDLLQSARTLLRSYLPF